MATSAAPRRRTFAPFSNAPIYVLVIVLGLLTPDEPTVTGRFLASSTLRTSTLCQTYSTCVDSVERPIQFIFATSYLTALSPVT